MVQRHDIDDENNDKDNCTEVEWVMITWREEASVFHESVAQPCFLYVFSTSFFVSPRQSLSKQGLWKAKRRRVFFEDLSFLVSTA